MPKVGVEHPKYGYASAPFPSRLRGNTFAYARSIAAKQLKGYSRPREYYEQEATNVAAFFKKIEAFAPILSEADVANLATTCHMGTRSRGHAQPDEGRDVGGNFVIKWNEDILGEVQKDWARYYATIPDKDDLQLVLPTGTSLGWPFLFPDDARGVRTLVLAAMALGIDVEKQRGTPLEEMLNVLAARYGPRFITPGWRHQHSSKVMPVFTGNRQLWTQNVEYRTRLIAMVDKWAVVYNRLVSKRAVKTALSMPQHDQRRPVISTTLTKWNGMRGCKCVAVDVSGFDNGFGGPNLVRLLKILSTVFGDGKEHANLVAEVTAPMLVPYSNLVYQTTERVTPQLPSGASFTTAIGLLASDYIARLLIHHSGKVRGDAPTQMDWLSWGDDIVMRFPDDVNVKEVFRKVSLEIGLEFDFEPTLKYLGFDYASGELKTNLGYSTGRLIQKSIYPESPTAYPYSIIGYCARLSFVSGDPAFFHQTFTQHFWDPVKYGPPFRFDQMKDVLNLALEKAALEPRPNRDSLNFLLHGLDPIEGADLLPMDFDFTKWVGKSYIDVSDPERAISLGDPELADLAKPWLRKIKDQGTVAVSEFVDTLGQQLRWRRLGVWT